MPIGVVRLILADDSMDFWVKGLFLGTVYFATTYGINHITNSQGFCVLTSLENYYREKANMPRASARFIPRFHKAVKNLLKKEKIYDV